MKEKSKDKRGPVQCREGTGNCVNEDSVFWLPEWLLISAQRQASRDINKLRNPQKALNKKRGCSDRAEPGRGKSHTKAFVYPGWEGGLRVIPACTGGRCGESPWIRTPGRALSCEGILCFLQTNITKETPVKLNHSGVPPPLPKPNSSTFQSFQCAFLSFSSTTVLQ